MIFLFLKHEIGAPEQKLAILPHQPRGGLVSELNMYTMSTMSSGMVNIEEEKKVTFLERLDFMWFIMGTV